MFTVTVSGVTGPDAGQFNQVLTFIHWGAEFEELQCYWNLEGFPDNFYINCFGGVWTCGLMDTGVNCNFTFTADDVDGCPPETGWTCTVDPESLPCGADADFSAAVLTLECAA